MSGGTAVEVVTWVFAGLCGVALVGRSLIKLQAIRHIGADDIFIWAAFLCYIGQSAGAQVQVENGLGLPLSEVPTDTVLMEMKGQYVKHLFYMPVTAFAKLSVVSMLRKCALHRKDRRLLYTFEWFLAVWAVASELVWAFSCEMPEPWNHYNKCISRDGWIIFFELVNAFTEMALIIIPTLSIARMPVPPKQKIVAISFFWARIVIIPVTILIIIYNKENDNGFTLMDVPYVIATMVVAALEILSACVLYARPLFEILETGSFTIASQPASQRDSQPPGSRLFEPTSKGSWPFTRMSSAEDARAQPGYTAKVQADNQDVEKEGGDSVEDIHVQRQVDVLSSNVQRAHIADLYPRDQVPPVADGPHSAQDSYRQRQSAHHPDVLPWEDRELPPIPAAQQGTFLHS